MKTEFYIEVFEKKVSAKSLFETVKDIWKAEGNRVKDLDSLELFYKPEEGRCYYVINSEPKGYFEA